MPHQRRRFADFFADFLADFLAGFLPDFFADFVAALLAVRVVFLADFDPPFFAAFFAAFFTAFFAAGFLAERALDVDFDLARDGGAFAALAAVIPPADKSCNAKPAPCGSPRIAIVPPGISNRGRCTNAPAFVAMSIALPTSFTWM